MVVWEVVSFFFLFLNMQNTTSVTYNWKKKRFKGEGKTRVSCSVLLREAEDQPRYCDENLCGTRPLVLPSLRSTSKTVTNGPLESYTGACVTREGKQLLASYALDAKGEV